MNFDGYLAPITDEPDLEVDLFLRQSTIGSMELCPARVGYSLHDGFKGTPSEPMSWGSLVHEMLENFIKLHEVVDVYELWTPTYALEQWEKVAERDGFLLGEVAGSDLLTTAAREAVVACFTWLDDWWEPVLRFAEIEAVEVKVTQPLGVLPSGRKVWFHGTPDLVTAERVWDWKTSGRGWKDGKELYGPQAPLYLWLLGRDGGEFTHLIYNRQDQTWERRDHHVTRERIDAALRNAWMRAGQIDSGYFPYTPIDSTFGKLGRGWWCSPKYCGAWDVCEGKHVDEQFVGETIQIGWEA